MAADKSGGTASCRERLHYEECFGNFRRIADLIVRMKTKLEDFKKPLSLNCLNVMVHLDQLTSCESSSFSARLLHRCCVLYFFGVLTLSGVLPRRLLIQGLAPPSETFFFFLLFTWSHSVSPVHAAFSYQSWYWLSGWLSVFENRLHHCSLCVNCTHL